MKKLKILILTSIYILLTSNIVHATVWTVSNDPDRPAQFTSIQAAVDNAAPNDTLRIAGSSTNYTQTIDIKIPLTLIGEGANNPDGENTTVQASVLFGRLNNSMSSSGSRIYGILFMSYSSPSVNINGYFGGGNADDFKIEDIQFERCHFNIKLRMESYNYSNILFRHCVFSNHVYFKGNHLGNVFTNCVFDSELIIGEHNNNLNGGIIIRNCLFLNRIYSCFSNIIGIIIENSIFYKCEPSGAENSVFNNNITYLCNNNTLPYSSNVGSGNLENTNPMFTDYPALGGSFDWAHDYTLLSGSPGIGTGTNGTNIGLDGGNAPVANIPGHSRIPVVDNLVLPTSSVPVGGNLEINIQAHIRD